MNRSHVYQEMESKLGLVPGMFQALPDFTLEHEWELFKRVQVENGAVPNKYRELAGLAISAAAKCKYCIFFHTEMARLSGATDAEIEDILHYAKSSAGWSTYISGMQIDFEKFKAEVRQICDHLRKHHAPTPPVAEIADYSEVGGFS